MKMHIYNGRLALRASLVLAVLATGCGTKSSSVTLPAFGSAPEASSAPTAPSEPAVSEAPLALLSPDPTPAPTATPAVRASAKPAPAASSKPSKNTVTASPSPSPTPAASATPTPVSATDIVNGALQQFNATSTYTATLDTFEVGPTKSLQATVNASFRKPSSFRLQVVSSSDAQAQGGTMVFTGGGTVQVKVGNGLFAGTVLNLSLTDARLLSPRGDRLDQSDVQSVLRQFTESGARVAYLGTATLNSRPAQVLELQAPSLLARGVAKAHIAFDTQDKYLVLREEYDAAGKLTLRMTIRNVELNPPLAAMTFSLS